jgi:predicted PurR-regulated permease PerM
MRAESFRWAIRGAALALGAAFTLAILQVAFLAREVVILVVAAILLASALQPAIDTLRSVANVPRGVIILGVYLVFFGVVLALAALVLPAAIGQLASLVEASPQFFESARSWAAGLTPPELSQAATALVEAAQETLAARPPRPGEVVEAGLTAAQVVASLATVLPLVFFWLVEHARLQRYALAFVPAGRRAGAREAWDDVELRLGYWVRGQLILMAVMAVATGVLYFILGLPNALLLGLLAGLAEAIPIIGPILGAIPALLVAATIRPELVLAVVIAYLVIQFIEGNVLVPIVMKRAIGMSAFMVIISLLVGAAVGGVVGAFLAIPLVAAFEVVLERLQARETPVTQIPPDPEPELAK